MQAEAQAGTEVYISHFVEIFAWVLTVPAYEALWELLYPSVNPYGWGYDYWYDQYARVRVAGHRMGIVSTVAVKHEQQVEGGKDGNGNGKGNVKGQGPLLGRTETATEKQKWRGVLAQEKVYNSHFGVNLKKCREKALPNATLFGGVYGYLSDTGSVGVGVDVGVGVGVKGGDRKGVRGVMEEGSAVASAGGGGGGGVGAGGGGGKKRRKRRRGDREQQ